METLDKHFRDLTRAVFARYGFAYAEVVARWPEIAGDELAGISRPERIRWPRSSESGRKTGGTLIVSAAPGRALDLQYEVPRIIERINRFYGHNAIAAVRVTASQDLPRGPSGPPPSPRKSIESQSLERIEDDPLKAALRRLGEAVASRAPSSPQGK